MKKYAKVVKLANGGVLTPQEQKAKELQNNNTGYQVANSIAGMIPGYGSVAQIALAGTQVAKNTIKRDEYGYARNQAGVVGDEIFNPLLGDVINDASQGDWGGVAKNLVGFAKPIRTLSKITGNNNSTSGVWGKLNNYSGVTEQNENKQAYIDSENALKASKEAEDQAAQLAEQERIKKQQDMYNAASASANPLKGYANTGIYAKGGTLPLASDVNKVTGPSHESGGVDINAGGNKVAEVEGGEVIHDNRVFSDRLKLNGKTYAKIAESLGKQKGKFEKLSESTNYREKNTGQRGLANVESSLNNLFITQEQSKPVDNTAKLASGGDLLKIAGMVAPMADNIYNAYANSKTPEIPTPNKRVSYDMTAMPMQTRYEVGNQLADVSNYNQNLTKNIYANSSSSAVARGEAANAFANTIGLRNNIFANKANMETSLVNANNQNIQNVNNANIKNRQDVDNMNYALTDNFNMAKTGRADNMLKNQSANVANAVDDYNMMMKGNNQENLDNRKMMLDTLKYSNGASAASLIGTSEMEGMLASDPTYYKQVESILESSGQTKSLETFRSTYKSKYGKK